MYPSAAVALHRQDVLQRSHNQQQALLEAIAIIYSKSQVWRTHQGEKLRCALGRPGSLLYCLSGCDSLARRAAFVVTWWQSRWIASFTWPSGDVRTHVAQ